MSVKQKIGWFELVAHEPRLDEVLRECREIANRREATWTDCSRMKREAEQLVGWHSTSAQGLLATSEAYETVLEVIVDTLGL